MANKQDNITLVAIDFEGHDLTRYALDQTLKQITPKEIVIISDKEILSGATHIIRPPVANMSEYANLMLKGVNEHVNTSHALYVQWDGIAVDNKNWTDEFLKYDYIGAPWPWKQEGVNVGNGGFSLRSKKLLTACMDDRIQSTKDNWAEDTLIADTHRSYLSGYYGIKYAPTNLAKQFSFELGTHEPSFGFHGIWNVFNLMTDADMDYYAPRIDYTGWNVYRWHHVLRALIRRNRMDIYEFMIEMLVEHNPEMLDNIAARLEYTDAHPRSNLVID
jgi:hypothetical protein